MYVVKGERIKVRRLILDDVYAMQIWGKHENPLFYDYNFPVLNEREVREWYRIKTSEKRKECYAILDEKEKLIGYLTIKNIKKIKKCATLGIVFDPNYMDKGYGTETIKAFLEYFFYNLKMKFMILEVAKYNKRAMKCYKKCGFETIDKYKKLIHNPSFNIQLIRKCEKNGFFYIDEKRIYCYIYRMKIERERFDEIRST